MCCLTTHLVAKSGQFWAVEHDFVVLETNAEVFPHSEQELCDTRVAIQKLTKVTQ